MKKFISLILVIMLLGSVVMLMACGNTNNNTDLQTRIAELEKLLEDANNSSGTGNVANDVATLKTTVATLQETITTLTAILNDSATGNTALKAKLDKLTADLDAAKARVAILEGIANGSDKLPEYEVGVEGKDTFTFVNNGIKLFSVRLISYSEITGSAGIYLSCELINFSMPTTINVSNYINITGVNILTKKTFNSSNGRNYTAEFNTVKEILFRFPLNINEDIPNEDITHFYIGIPNQISSSSIIPYAIFTLPIQA